MKKKMNFKNKLLSLLMVVAMVVGSIGGWQVRQDAGEVQATDVEESTGYRELTLRDWGYSDSFVKDTNTLKNSKTPISSWDKVAVSGYATFDTTSPGSYIGFEVISGKYVALRYNPSTNQMRLGGASVSATGGDKYSNAEIIAGEEVYFRLTFDVSGNTLTVGMYINEAEPVYATYATSGTAYGMIISPNLAGATISYRSIEKTYTELSFNDFGFEDDTYTATQRRDITWLKSFDDVAFTGEVTFAQVGTTDSAVNCIALGGKVDNDNVGWDNCIRIFLHQNGNLYILSKLTSAGGTIGSLTANEVGLDSFTEKKIKIRLTFDFDDTNTDAVTVQASFEANETSVTKDALTITGGEAVLTRTDGFRLIVAPNGSAKIGSTISKVTMDDVAYDIEKEPYLLTSYHEATVMKDGESVDIADCILKDAGDYKVQTKHSGVIAERTVSLYVLGDVDLSESTVGEEGTIALDANDVATLKNIIAGSASATPAQKKAADLNNDGEISNTDLKLLQDIVAGNTTRAEVLKRYYPASVTYNFLGSKTEDSSEVMPIVGYRGPTGDNLTNESFKAIANTGINMINYLANENFSNPSAVLKELEYAENNHLGIFVTDANLKPWALNEIVNDEGEVTGAEVVECTQVTEAEELSKLIGRYSYFDSYLGNFLVDEPVIDETDTSAQGIAYFQDVAAALNSYTNMEGYINIAAGYWFYLLNDTTYHLTSDTMKKYEDEVKYIVDNAGVNVLSFDRYLTDTETVAKCPRYMLNLDIIRSQAKDSDIPFWAYVPAGGGWADGTVPTKEELNWQVNMSLAWGAKGIQYYTLYTGADIDAGIMNEDATTDWYSIVSKANNQISAVDEVLMKATNLGVYATDGHALDNLENIKYWDTESSAEKTKSVDAAYTLDNLEIDFGVQRVESVTTSGDYGALAGVFNYQGKTALYVVNYDTTEARDITVAFDKASNYRVIDANQDVTGYAESYTQNVQPGEAFLLVIEEEEVETTWQEFANVAELEKFKNEDETYSAPELDGYVFSGWYGAKQVEDVISDTYKRYTFANWGLTDNYVENNNYKDSTLTPITSWNNVAVHGYVSYTAGGKIVFDTAGNVGEGAQVFYSATEKKIGLGGRGVTMSSNASGTQSNPVYSDTELTEGEEAYIRVLFSEESAGVLKVTLYVNDAEPVCGYFTGGAYGTQKCSIRIQGTTNGHKVVYRSAYKEMTFSDWGLTDNYVENNNYKDSTLTPITSWNNVAVHGYVSYTAGGRIVFDTAGNVGVGAQVFYSATEKKIGLGGRGVTMSSNASGTQSNPVYSDTELTEGEEAYIRVLFSEESAGVLKITLYVNDAEPVCGYFTGGAYGTPKCSIRIQGTTNGHKVIYRSWQSEGVPEVAITDLENYVGRLWAKFVDESILTVKAQLASGTTATQTDTTKIRLVSTVDSEHYENVGFKVATTKNPTGVDVPSTTVYSKIVAADGRLSVKYTPDVFDSHSKYFITLTLAGLPVIDSSGNDRTEDPYTITPFWTTLDGTRVYGQTRALTVAQGLRISAGTYSEE